MRFDYLKPAIGEVVDGLEDHEKIYALDQAQYNPLRTLPGENGMSAISRWELTPDQRKMIADGADILLEVHHFGGPLAPVRMMVLDQTGLNDGEKQHFASWMAGCLNLKVREKE